MKRLPLRFSIFVSTYFKGLGLELKSSLAHQSQEIELHLRVGRVVWELNKTINLT